MCAATCTGFTNKSRCAPLPAQSRVYSRSKPWSPVFRLSPGVRTTSIADAPAASETTKVVCIRELELRVAVPLPSKRFSVVCGRIGSLCKQSHLFLVVYRPPEQDLTVYCRRRRYNVQPPEVSNEDSSTSERKHKATAATPSCSWSGIEDIFHRPAV